MIYRGKVTSIKNVNNQPVYTIAMHHPSAPAIVFIESKPSMDIAVSSEVALDGSYTTINKLLTIEEVMEESKPRAVAKLAYEFLEQVSKSSEVEKILMYTGSKSEQEVIAICERAFDEVGTCWQGVTFTLNGAIMKIRDLADHLSVPYYKVMAYYHTHSSDMLSLLRHLGLPCYRLGGAYYSLEGIAKRTFLRTEDILAKRVPNRFKHIFHVSGNPAFADLSDM